MAVKNVLLMSDDYLLIKKEAGPVSQFNKIVDNARDR
jgi:hypothetical protein